MTVGTVEARKLVQLVIPVADLVAARNFYVDVLGLQLLFEAPNVTALAAGEVRILLAESSGAGGPAGILPYFGTSDIEATHRRIIADHGPEAGPPHRIATLGDTEVWISQLSDPNGNILGLLEERPLTHGSR